MKDNIVVFMPNRGIGDAIFHYRFCKSLYNHHNKTITLIAPRTTKANQIYKNNKIFRRIILLNLQRPSFLGYFKKILYIVNKLLDSNYEKIYYTGDHKWQIISLLILKLFKRFELIYSPIKKYYIIDHLDFLLKKSNIDLDFDNNLKISDKISKKKKLRLSKYKKPWVFISIDTAADQIKIPEKYLELIINKLKKKYNTIFLNTNRENKNKIKPFLNNKIIPTFEYNILEINYIMKNSKLFIGNDSGPGNLSTLLNHKSIIFLSKNTSGEIKKIMSRGKRIFIIVEQIEKKIINLLKFI